MSRNAKVAIVKTLGGLGVIMILIGALAHVYATTTGVIIAIGIWIACEILSRYWGLKKKRSILIKDVIYYIDKQRVVNYEQ